MKLCEFDAHPAAARTELFEDIREALTRALSDTLARLTSRENLARLVAETCEKRIAAEPSGVSSDSGPEALTARELEILKRIADGESNKAIARTLDLSIHTVKRHVANILGKLGVSTRVQAATWLSARH